MAGIFNIDSIINDTETAIFEEIHKYFPAEEYDKTYSEIKSLLNRLEGHNGSFDVWFTLHKVSVDDYEWSIGRDVGLCIDLKRIVDIDWKFGGVWSVNDADDVMTLILRFLKEQSHIQRDYTNEHIKCRFNGFKNITKKETGELDSLFIPGWYFTRDWWFPHEQ